MAETVDWFNVPPTHPAIGAANKLYSYEISVGIERILHDDHPHDVADTVRVKTSEKLCHTKFVLGRPGVISYHTMEVDGMPRHVCDLRSAVPPEAASTRAHTFSDDEDLPRLPAHQGFDGRVS